MIEHQTVETLAQGATPLQITCLVVLGAILACALIGICIYLIHLHIGNLPDDLKTLSAAVVRLESRLWSHEEINDSIEKKANEAISAHVDKWHLSKTQIIGESK